MINLFFQNTFNTNSVYPQLKEVAYWLSFLRDDFLEVLIKIDYTTLVNKNSNHLTDNQKEKLVDFHLDKVLRNEQYIGWKDTFKGFVFEGIENKIIQYLNGENIKSKSFAIQLAFNCKFKEKLFDPMMQISLNQNELIGLREDSLGFIGEFGTDFFKKQLTPLLLDCQTFKNDKEDELRGGVLMILWDKFISVDTVIENMTKPKRPDFHGSYSGFLNHHFHKKITNRNILPVLEWIKDKGGDQLSNERFKGLHDKIYKLAFSFLGNKEIFEKFIEITLEKIERKDYINLKLFFKNDSSIEKENKIILKRKIIEAVVKGFSENCVKSNKSRLFNSSIRSFQVLNATDFHWAVGKLIENKNNLQCSCWVEILWITCHIHKSNHFDTLYDIYHNDSISDFNRRFINTFEPIYLNSKEAKWLKESRQYEINQKNREIKEQQKKINNELEIEIALKNFSFDLLEKIEKFHRGNSYSWYGIVNQFVRLSNINRSSITPVLTKTSEWVRLNGTVKNNIVEVAKSYLQNANNTCTCGEWEDVENCKFLEYSFIAIHFVLEYESDFLDKHQLWKRWAATILYSSRKTFFEEEIKKQNALISMLHSKEPRYVLELVLKKIDYRLDDVIKFTSFLEVISCIKNENLNNYLHSLLIGLTYFDDRFEKLIDYLLWQEYLPTICWIEDMIHNQTSIANIMNHSMIILKIFNKYPSKYLSKIFNKLQQEQKFAKDFIRVLANQFDRKGYKLQSHFLSNFSEGNLTDWYVLLYKTFPLPTRYDSINSRSSEENAIGELEETILNNLKSRTNPIVIDCLKRIEREFDRDLSYSLYQAKKNINFHSWQPLKAKELLPIIKKHKLPINDENQLLELVFKTLQEIQMDLKQGKEFVESLWNQNGYKDPPINKIPLYTPKTENKISNVISKNLKEKLQKVVINREIEVNTRGGNSGDRLDIFIEGFDENGEAIMVIIEAKGSWNSAIKTSMENQLVKQYLDNHQSRSGIYLIYYILDSKLLDEKSREYKASRKTKEFASLSGYRKFYAKQSEKMSARTNYSIKSFVLDCTFDQKEE